MTKLKGECLCLNFNIITFLLKKSFLFYPLRLNFFVFFEHLDDLNF